MSSSADVAPAFRRSHAHHLVAHCAAPKPSSRPPPALARFGFFGCCLGGRLQEQLLANACSYYWHPYTRCWHVYCLRLLLPVPCLFAETPPIEIVVNVPRHCSIVARIMGLSPPTTCSLPALPITSVLTARFTFKWKTWSVLVFSHTQSFSSAVNDWPQMGQLPRRHSASAAVAGDATNGTSKRMHANGLFAHMCVHFLSSLSRFHYFPHFLLRFLCHSILVSLSRSVLLHRWFFLSPPAPTRNSSSRLLFLSLSSLLLSLSCVLSVSPTSLALSLPTFSVSLAFSVFLSLLHSFFLLLYLFFLFSLCLSLSLSLSRTFSLTHTHSLSLSLALSLSRVLSQ